MSVSHNHRRKTIRRFKKQFGKDWYPKFRAHCDEIRRQKDGPLLGSLQDLMDLKQKISPSEGELATALPVSAVVSP